MAKLYNRARVTVSSTGTGTLTLSTAVAGYQTFTSAGVQNGDVVSYVIEDGLNWECGTGTFTTSTNTLTRTVTQSFNGSTYGTAAISVTASAQVFISPLAADLSLNGLPGSPLSVANGGTGSTTAFTTGSVVFAGASGVYSQNNANLFWDNTNARLGIGTASPNSQTSIDGGSGTVSAVNSVGLGALSLSYTPSTFGITNRIVFGTAQAAGFAFASIAGSYDSYTTGPGGSLVFSTSNAAGTSGITERMRIDSAGRFGIGTTTSTTQDIWIGGNSTGNTTQYGVLYNKTTQSDVTGTQIGFTTSLATAAAAFTLSEFRHFSASFNTIGAGSTVTSQYGFYASSGLTGATNNYGFYSGIASGTGRWNFYAAGTAANWFSGDVLIFGAGGIGYTTGSGGAVTQATSRTTGVTLNKTNGAITLVSAAGSATYQTFTVTNSAVAATDTIILNQKSGTDKYILLVTNVGAGSFQITFATTGGTTTEQPVISFAVIKAVTA